MSWGQGSTRAGRKARQQTLDDANHLCQARLSGCIGSATDAHHIQSITQQGLTRAQALDQPMIAVCTPCHTQLTRQQRLAGQAQARARRGQRMRPRQPHPGDLT